MAAARRIRHDGPPRHRGQRRGRPTRRCGRDGMETKIMNSKHENAVQVAGVLEEPAAVRISKSGHPIATFLVRVIVGSHTNRVRIKAFNGLAEKIQRVDRGDFVRITGRLQTVERSSSMGEFELVAIEITNA